MWFWLSYLLQFSNTLSKQFIFHSLYTIQANSLVEQELLILWEHLRSPLVLSCGVRVFQSLVFCQAFCRHWKQPLYFLVLWFYLGLVTPLIYTCDFRLGYTFDLRVGYTIGIFKLVSYKGSYGIMCRIWPMWTNHGSFQSILIAVMIILLISVVNY